MRSKTVWNVGDLVTYQHPDWGRSTGRILSVQEHHPGRYLVEDLHRDGAREYWPISGLRSHQEGRQCRLPL